MDIEEFIDDRRPSWNRLRELLTVAETSAPWELGADGIEELVHLYRQVCSDLNQARSFTAQGALLDELNQLAGRGYRFVYRGGRRGRFAERLKAFFAYELPATFRRQGRTVLAAALAMLLGAGFAFMAVLADRFQAEDLIPEQFFSASPKERVEQIEAEEERIETLEQGLVFGASLYVHNIQVAFLAFSLGALTVFGAYWILFYNGTILGAVAALYLLDGVEVFFLAWVGPHGALELPAIVFAGAAGLVAGRALYLPGNLTRQASLRRAFPSVVRLLIGTCVILVVAGLVEGSFSQYSAKTVPYAFKISLAVGLFGGLVTYLFLWKRRSVLWRPDDSV